MDKLRTAYKVSEDEDGLLHEREMDTNNKRVEDALLEEDPSQVFPSRDYGDTLGSKDGLYKQPQSNADVRYTRRRTIVRKAKPGLIIATRTSLLTPKRGTQAGTSADSMVKLPVRSGILPPLPSDGTLNITDNMNPVRDILLDQVPESNASSSQPLDPTASQAGPSLDSASPIYSLHTVRPSKRTRPTSASTSTPIQRRRFDCVLLPPPAHRVTPRKK
ncbi:hypothetical protein RhiJN_22629 [Ceratobasidium sp. AG-Ba]|nr:hypothetical protein RhiJN_22629 [Ceratobasidium sp. AG-Ba]